MGSVDTVIFFPILLRKFCVGLPFSVHFLSKYPSFLFFYLCLWFLGEVFMYFLGEFSRDNSRCGNSSRGSPLLCRVCLLDMGGLYYHWSDCYKLFFLG